MNQIKTGLLQPRPTLSQSRQAAPQQSPPPSDQWEAKRDLGAPEALQGLIPPGVEGDDRKPYLRALSSIPRDAQEDVVRYAKPLMGRTLPEEFLQIVHMIETTPPQGRSMVYSFLSKSFSGYHGATLIVQALAKIPPEDRASVAMHAEAVQHVYYRDCMGPTCVKDIIEAWGRIPADTRQAVADEMHWLLRFIQQPPLKSVTHAGGPRQIYGRTGEIDPSARHALLCALGAIAPEDLAEVMECAEKFIKRDTPGYARIQIIEALGRVPPAEWPNLKAQTERLLVPSADAALFADILGAVGKVPDGERADLVDNVLALTGNDRGDMRSIVETLTGVVHAERAPLVAEALKLILPDMNGAQRRNIVASLARVPADERASLTELALRVFTPKMDAQQRGGLLESLGRVPAPERAQLPQQAASIAGPHGSVEMRRRILDTLVGITPGAERAQVVSFTQQLIGPGATRHEREKLLTILSEVPADERAKLMQQAVRLKSEHTNHRMLQALANVPAAQRDGLVEYVQENVTTHTGLFAIVDTLATLMSEPEQFTAAARRLLESPSVEVDRHDVLAILLGIPAREQTAFTELTRSLTGGLAPWDTMAILRSLVTAAKWERTGLNTCARQLMADVALWAPRLQDLPAAHRVDLAGPFIEACLGKNAAASWENLPAVVQQLLDVPARSNGTALSPETPPALFQFVCTALDQPSAKALRQPALRLLQPLSEEVPKKYCLSLAVMAANENVPVAPWLQRANLADPAVWVSELDKLDATRPLPEEAVQAFAAKFSERRLSLRAALQGTFSTPGSKADAMGILKLFTAHPEFLRDSSEIVRLGAFTDLAPEQVATVRDFLLSRPKIEQRRLIDADLRNVVMVPGLYPAYAASWLRRPQALEAHPDPALNTLARTINQQPVSHDPHVEAPELALVHHPKELLESREWNTLLNQLGSPAWVGAALSAEKAPKNHDAAFAQSNRLRALGYYLHWCRATGIENTLRDAAGPVVTQLLAIPDDRIRHTLLRHLVGTCLAQGPEQARVALQDVLAVADRAKPLALASALVLQDNAHRAPHVTALLQNRAVYTHGLNNRALLGLLASALAGDIPPAFVQETLGWANDQNLQNMFNNPANRARRSKLLMLAKDVATSTNKSAAMDLLHQEVQLHDTVCATRSAWAQDLKSRRSPVRIIEDVPEEAWEELQEGLAWLGTLPAFKRVAEDAANLCEADLMPDPKSWDAVQRLRAALKAPAMGDVPRWQIGYCDVLLHDLQTLLPPRDTDYGPVNVPTQEFFSQVKVATFMKTQVLPMMLALANNASLLESLGKKPGDFSEAAGILTSSLQWTGLPESKLQQIEAHPDLKYLNTYVSSITGSWSPGLQDLAMPVMHSLAEALAARSLKTWRRQAPQAQKILSMQGGDALLQKWETSAPLQVASTKGLLTVADTGHPAAMLAASTQISSCQAATCTTGTSRGNLSRMRDASKRMVAVRDANGTLRGRGMARLMESEGKIVLLASTLYSAAGTSEQYQEVVHAWKQWVAERAQGLGIVAFIPDFAGDYVEFHSAGDTLPDYWDEDRGNWVGDVSFEARVRAPILGQNQG